MRRERVFRDTTNVFDSYDDLDFRMRFRFSRQIALSMIDDFREELEHGYYATDLDASLQILIALRFFATGSFQRVVGDLNGVSISSAHRCIHKVARAIASRKERVISGSQSWVS